MQKPELVIFDCDGVLVDSEVIGNTIMAKSLSAHGLVVSLEECMALFVGGTMAGVKVQAEGLGATLPEDWVEQIYAEIYAELRLNCPLIAGVTEVLDALDATGVPYCVASNGRFEKMEITLGQNGILERFGGRIYSAQALGTAKPAPELFWHAAQGANHAHCVVIEDSLNGIRGAAAAGMRCFAYAPEGGEVEGATRFTKMAQLPALLHL
ncbi:MAG: HAD-IA family hydrolase [Rhodobacteraceae bacterium]|nr:HAD-IA family hydrolase [Paracoccaceae bacterium]